MSPFDRANVGKILNGHGDWFGAYLLRLIAKAEKNNRERLRAGFPVEVAAFEEWQRYGEVKPEPQVQGAQA